MADLQIRKDRRSGRHQATRMEILDAVWVIARERGLSGWSLRDVADAVDMRAPSLYVYFDSKNALYDGMFQQGYREFVARIQATPTDGSPVQVLHRAAHLFFDFCVEDPARYQLLFLRTIPGFVPTNESYTLAESTLERLIDMVVAAGLRPAAVDLWTALFTGLASQQISNDPGGDRWSRLVDDAADMLIAHSR